MGFGGGRFDVEYTSLPLGAKQLQAFVLEACEREQAAPVESGMTRSEDVAEALLRGAQDVSKQQNDA